MSNKKDFDFNKLVDNILDGTKNITDSLMLKGGEFVKDSGLKDIKDYYSFYTWPPLNLYSAEDESLIFEFGLPGFVKDDIVIDFEDDFLLFSATLSNLYSTGDNIRSYKKKLKLADIKIQKYFLPQDKYNRKNYSMHMKNGLLRLIFSIN